MRFNYSVVYRLKGSYKYQCAFFDYLSSLRKFIDENKSKWAWYSWESARND